MTHATCARAPGRIASVLIVDDHPLYGDALSAAISLVFEGCRIETAQTLRAGLDLVADGFAPDLAMFDLKLPDVSGISGFQSLRESIPDTPILVISSLTSVPVVDALMQAGAAGFLPKDASAQVLRSALADVSTGRKFVPAGYQRSANGAPADALCESAHPKLAELTPQQARIMQLIRAGKPNKQIAYDLNLAEATVKAHITALLRRLGVQNRTQAAVLVEAAEVDGAGGLDPDSRAFLSQ
ncbi:response regulator [Roseivivax sediminis]|uniref:DNA-binding response regulator, NarL/FixJ family, contains REC and HTH domains n=1 Tax=Roseivivax sediminis TaxID=936889 RepID=A0A1I1U0G5_9RHOB|nr:response regulator transcription factor [Roseivivax sediminis]SFD63088.1 DNA-binding response regulator, NarL/FixJ family, contains REC and HTH domains [Roseivivax sediminis]